MCMRHNAKLEYLACAVYIINAHTTMTSFCLHSLPFTALFFTALYANSYAMEDR